MTVRERLALCAMGVLVIAVSISLAFRFIPEVNWLAFAGCIVAVLGYVTGTVLVTAGLFFHEEGDR